MSQAEIDRGSLLRFTAEGWRKCAAATARMETLTVMSSSLRRVGGEQNCEGDGLRLRLSEGRTGGVWGVGSMILQARVGAETAH